MSHTAEGMSREARAIRQRVDARVAQVQERAAGEREDSAFLPWLETVTPKWNWRWPHLLHVQEHLEAVGPDSRLMLFMPPRHGKTEMTTVRYAAYRLERDPTLRIIIGSYNQTLANKFSRKIRRIVRDRGIQLNPERQAAEDWETSSGGGVRAVGVGGGIAGHGADLIIVDDPIRSREDADSATFRDRVWEWWSDDLNTRCEPGAAMVLIMTRWHGDDLAGRVLAGEDAPNWKVVNLPAEAEEDDPLGRAEGQPLCPERFPKAALARMRMILGSSYYALYQQRPQPKGGSMFERGWFEIVNAPPRLDGTVVRWWDHAATEGGGDWTVGCRLRMRPEGVVYVEDVERFQHSAGKRDERIRAVAERDGHDVTQWTAQDPGAAGKAAVEAFVRLLRGYTAKARTESGSKELRAEPFASYAQAGQVKLVRAAWNEKFLDELTTFPWGGRHDDQVDAASNAYAVIARRGAYALEGIHDLGTLDFGGPSPWTIE